MVDNVPRNCVPIADAGFSSLHRPGQNWRSLHSLRHTYISHLVMAGIPLRVVQKLTGHAHHSTTERYAHLAPNFMQDLRKKINL